MSKLVDIHRIKFKILTGGKYSWPLDGQCPTHSTPLVTMIEIRICGTRDIFPHAHQVETGSTVVSSKVYNVGAWHGSWEIQNLHTDRGARCSRVDTAHTRVLRAYAPDGPLTSHTKEGEDGIMRSLTHHELPAPHFYPWALSSLDGMDRIFHLGVGGLFHPFQPPIWPTITSKVHN